MQSAGRIGVVAALGLVWTLEAEAQSGEKPSQDPAPRTQTIQAVERGPYVQADLGVSYVANSVGDLELGLGAVIGAYIGFDVLPILGIAVGGVATTASSQSSDPGADDLFFVGPMARLQLALLTSERDFFWIRAEGGYAFGLPEEVEGRPVGGNGPAFGGGLVFEHFTKLRHFSLGLSVGALVYTEPDVAVSIQIAPLLKYTF